MKIAINTRFLLAGKLEGIGWYTYHITKRLIENHPEDQFYLLFDRKPPKEFSFGKNAKVVILSPPARHPILWHIWFQISVSRFLKRKKPDVFLSPDGFLSLKTKVPQVSVIHDINFMHYPEFIPKAVKKYYQKYFPLFAHKADTVVTVSEYSKRDLTKTFGLEEDKIEVTYNASQSDFKPQSESEKEKVRNEITAGKPYFLFVGAFNPRKNLPALFKAFDEFAKLQPDHQLVLVGEKMYWPEEIENAFEQMRFKNRVHFTGRLENTMLNKVFSASEALVFPSLLEGFGIPIVEAFEAGTAVITSNITALPEIAGDAAILINPENPEEISQAMVKLSSDKAFRKALIEKGAIQAKKFSWDHSAEKMWDILMDVAR